MSHRHPDIWEESEKDERKLKRPKLTERYIRWAERWTVNLQNPGFLPSVQKAQRILERRKKK